MPYTIVSGDLLLADTEYIVQQNCCTAVKAHGLSEIIAQKFSGVNPYTERTRFKGNWATLETRPKPGSIEIFENEAEEDTNTCKIICAFAQYCHGKPGVYKDPLSALYGDTFEDRFTYFKQCLELISDLKPKSVGFPYRIGCGLAGGSWSRYETAIKDWSLRNPTIDIKVYNMN